MQILTKTDKDTIIYKLTNEPYPKVVEVAKEFSKSRQAIYQVLKERNVNIKDYIWIKVTCDFCGKEFKKRRSYVRNSKKDFCCPEHLYEFKRKKKPEALKEEV